MAVKTYETTGRGRKQCPECESIVGVRTKECVCDYSFVKPSQSSGKPVEEPEEETLGEDEGRLRWTVYAPAGACPVELESTRLKDVEKWLVQVGEYGENNRMLYTTEAYKYYVRSFHNVHSNEYKKVARHIDSIMDEV